jgi:hypothetical protein
MEYNKDAEKLADMLKTSSIGFFLLALLAIVIGILTLTNNLELGFICLGSGFLLAGESSILRGLSEAARILTRKP